MQGVYAAQEVVGADLNGWKLLCRMFMANLAHPLPRPQRAVRMGHLLVLRNVGKGVGMKRCSKCVIEKDESEFHTYNRKGKTYTDSYCKTCKKKYSIAWFNRLSVKERAEYYSQHRGNKTCNIIKNHHEEMKDDPEHMTTEFIQKIVGRKC